MNRTDRLLSLIVELQAKKWQRAEDLADTFEVSKRTIYRDMMALMESGVPVISSPGQGYALDEGYFLPPLSFNTDESIVLLLGTDFMQQTFDAQYQSAARSATSKIRAVLSQRLRDEVDDLQTSMRFIAVNPLESTASPETLQQLRRAILQHRTVRLDYHTRFTTNQEVAGSKTTRDVDPYVLVHLDNAWYVSGYCHLRHDTRNFRLDRIDRLQVLSTVFTRPDNFRLGPKPPTDKDVTARVLFKPAVARWVQEDSFFYVINMETQANGLLVTLRVRQESDLMQWLLGWGSNVHVLEPASLQQRLAAELATTLHQYQSPSNS
jgi:predicted DNA-binding transcriptional regulator YafY